MIGGGSDIENAICRHLSAQDRQTRTLNRTPAEYATNAFVDVDLLTAVNIAHVTTVGYSEDNEPLYLVASTGSYENDTAEENVSIGLVDQGMRFNFLRRYHRTEATHVQC